MGGLQLSAVAKHLNDELAIRKVAVAVRPRTKKAASGEDCLQLRRELQISEPRKRKMKYESLTWPVYHYHSCSPILVTRHARPGRGSRHSRGLMCELL